MKKALNYLSYCIYSFIPLYFLLAIYTLIKEDGEDFILVVVLILVSIISLVSTILIKEREIFVCSHKEVSKIKGIDYSNVILMIIITFLIINEKVQISFKVVFLLVIFLLLFKVSSKYKNYTLILLGYKMYVIRDKIVYSKKSEQGLYQILKEKKMLQIIEISNNIFIENEKYRMNNFYCEDF